MKKNIIFAGDFTLLSDQQLESAGGNPILKKLAVSKLERSVFLKNFENSFFDTLILFEKTFPGNTWLF